MASENEAPEVEETIEESETVEETFGQEDDDEDLDETFAERLLGLTEMFPNWMRNGVSAFTSGSVSSVKFLYGFSCSAMWIFFSSSAILIAPVIFEVERCQVEEMHKQQQRQILLGPNAAMAGSQPHFPMPMPSGPPLSR